MNEWGWQDSGPAGAAVSSAPAGGIQAEILRRQNMRLNPTAGNPFQINPQQRAGIMSQQIQAGTNSGAGNFKNGGMATALSAVPMLPNNGRPNNIQYANGVQMNPTMGGAPKMEQRPQMQSFQALAPSMPSGSGLMVNGTGANYAWNDAFRTANNMPIDHKVSQAADENYLRTVLGTKPQYKMPGSVGTQQQNPQQQLMMILQQMLGRG